MKKISKLFLDLDGVFADWDKKAREIFNGKHPKLDLKLPDSEMWPVLKNYKENGGMFASLDWMPNSKHLWEMTRVYNPTILTGIPRGTWATKQKMKWVEREMNHTNIICCPTPEKQKYSKEGYLLIDDRRVNIEQWRDKGGYGIHHESIEDTIEQLKEYDFSNIVVRC